MGAVKYSVRHREGEDSGPKSIIIDLADLWMIATTNERPMCPACKHRMALARISPGERGFEVRTFECSTCGRTEKLSLSVDPMKTDAVGWLVSELKPPN